MRIICIILFYMCMPQANFVLVIQPILVIGAKTKVNDPLFEALLGSFFIMFVRSSIGFFKIMYDVWCGTNYPTPDIYNFIFIVFKDRSRHVQVPDIFFLQRYGLLQLFEC